MNDLISRQDAINAIHKEFDEVCVYDESGQTIANEVENILYEIPSIEPERKKGKWIVTSEFEDCRYVKCNQCKVTQVFYYNKPLTNFCPNCGADMRDDER